MPGIFGVVDVKQTPGDLARERLDIVRRMASAMHYEPAYVADIVSCPTLSACAGRVGWSYRHSTDHRGSVLPQSALLTAGEPVVSRDTAAAHEGDCRAVGVGAGELARQIQRHGIEWLQHAEGAFAGFFMDQRRGKCLLFNDRYGVERLFVHTDNARVFFSSEAKAILAVAVSTSELDPTGLAEWLACGCTIGTRSLFRDVEVLAGGTAITFGTAGEVVRTRYFDRSALEQLPQLPATQFLEAFTEGLGAAVNAAIGRAPRAALSLTGGLDSRLVIACLDAAPRTVPCFTFGSMYRRTMDVSVARCVAAECEQPHQVLELDRRFLASVDEHLRDAVSASDGYLGLAGSAELYLNRLARQVAPARVTGNWGGELMRGVRAFKFRTPKGDFIHSSIRGLMGDVARTFAETDDWNPLSYTLFHQLPHQGFGRYAVERSQVQMRSPFLANNVVRALYQAPATTRSSIDVVSRVLMRRPALISIPTDTGRLGQSTLPVTLLRQAYRRTLVKAEYLTSHGAPDWMAALSARVPFIETAFLGRDKFQHFRVWMRNELAGWVRDVLIHDNQAALEPWFDMRIVSLMVENHVAGRANYTDEIDKLMTIAMLSKTAGPGRSANPAGKHSHHEMALERPVSF